MNTYFALNTPTIEVDPDINTIGLVVYALLILIAIGITLWHFMPVLYKKRVEKNKQQTKVANTISYNPKESQLSIGTNKKRIEPKSYEHFVCQITFSAPDEYHNDDDIQELKDNYSNSSSSIRGVEQAVRRLNIKAKEMGLKNDLFKRSKERTSVNDEYRLRVIIE